MTCSLLISVPRLKRLKVRGGEVEKNGKNGNSERGREREKERERASRVHAKRKIRTLTLITPLPRILFSSSSLACPWLLLIDVVD